MESDKMTYNPWTGPNFYWTIAPCFFACTCRSKEEMPHKLNDDIHDKVLFLLRRKQQLLVTVVLDMPAQFLYDQYYSIMIDSNNRNVRSALKAWLDDLRLRIKTEEGVEKVTINKDAINNNKKKLENILMCPAQADDCTDCFIKCVTICHYSVGNCLLTDKARLFKKAKIEEDFNLKVLNCEDAKESISLSILDTPESPEDIQKVLIKNYLPSIEKRIRERRDYNVYYSAKYKPQKELYITEHIFNDLNDKIEHAGMRCIHQAGTGAGTTDAIVSSGGHEVVIEAKKAGSDKELENGLVKELCANLKGRSADYGIYLIFYFDCACSKSIEESKEQVQQIKQEYASELQDYKIEIFWIDFSKRPSASKL